jgi:superfamily II DNA helicase RecQ
MYNGKDVIGNLPTGYGKSTCSIHALVNKTSR